MGIEEKGQVCIMIHSGSRGFGHQVATDALLSMEKAMKRDNIETNDRQLACARIHSQVQHNISLKYSFFAFLTLYYYRKDKTILKQWQLLPILLGSIVHP
jgi:hypothetical protein